MKFTIAVFAMLVALPTFAQSTIRIALTPRSNVPSNVVAKDMDKRCPGMVLTLDGEHADYLLEGEAVYAINGINIIRVQYTLFAPNGDTLMHTNPRNHGSGMKDVCAYIESRK
jgi:hypothetical protein